MDGEQARVASAPPNLYMPEDPTVSVMCGQGDLCHEHEGDCWRHVSLADHLCLSRHCCCILMLHLIVAPSAGHQSLLAATDCTLAVGGCLLMS